MCLLRFLTLLICNHKSLQKDLWLFRSSPYASVCVGKYLESELSDIPRHPHPRLPGGRLKSRKYKKPPLAVKKVRLTPVEKLITLFLIGAIDNTSSAMLSSTNHTSRCFFTANGGLFERPKAAFFTMAAVVAMHRMALGMVVTTKRKTCFPTGVTTVTKKAKPTKAAMAFCVYIILYYVLLQVTPSANRNSYRVALICGDLHPE